MSEEIEVTPVGRWGKFPTYDAKVGTFSGCRILIKRARKFTIGQRIEYAEEQNLRGMSTGCTPTWQPGKIWDIQDNRIFVNKS